MASIAEGIMDQSIHIVEGSRAIANLLIETYKFPSKDFDIFSTVSGKFAWYPVDPDARKLWNKDALKEKDSIYMTEIEPFRKPVNDACLLMINKFKNSRQNTA